MYVCLSVGKDENIRTNLRLYGLEDHYLDVLVADAANPVWRSPEMFDAIITDRTLSAKVHVPVMSLNSASMGTLQLGCYQYGQFLQFNKL